MKGAEPLHRHSLLFLRAPAQEQQMQLSRDKAHTSFVATFLCILDKKLKLTWHLHSQIRKRHGPHFLAFLIIEVLTTKRC